MCACLIPRTAWNKTQSLGNDADWHKLMTLSNVQDQCGGTDMAESAAESGALIPVPRKAAHL